jgi:hypothetical protein
MSAPSRSPRRPPRSIGVHAPPSAPSRRPDLRQGSHRGVAQAQQVPGLDRHVRVVARSPSSAGAGWLPDREAAALLERPVVPASCRPCRAPGEACGGAPHWPHRGTEHPDDEGVAALRAPQLSRLARRAVVHAPMPDGVLIVSAVDRWPPALLGEAGVVIPSGYPARSRLASRPGTNTDAGGLSGSNGTRGPVSSKHDVPAP